MANSTEAGNHTTSQELFCSIMLGVPQRIFISALALPLSISAFFGNVLIIAALFKVSSLHPPSKLLFGCLAFTDLGVALISHPVRSGFYLSPGHSENCHYLSLLSNSIGAIFCGVSFLTTTAISVDRLLALMLGLRYRHVVTVRRVWALVVAFWLFSPLPVIMYVCYSKRIATGITSAGLVSCIVIATWCYTKIYRTLRFDRTQVQDQAQQGQPNRGGIQLNKARYKRTVSTALWVQVAFVACYLPFGVVLSFMTITGLLTPSLDFVLALTISLLLFNSTLNPFLYCWKMREIRQEVKDTIRKSCCLSN